MPAPFYAILRYDPADRPTGDPEEILDRVSVKGIVSDPELGDREVERLNNLNSGKGCRYWLVPARLWPPPWRNGGKDGPQG